VIHPAVRAGALDAFAHNRPRRALLWAAITSNEELRLKALYRIGTLGWFRVLFGKYVVGSLAALALLILVAVQR
jgi:hypothetical protein